MWGRKKRARGQNTTVAGQTPSYWAPDVQPEQAPRTFTTSRITVNGKHVDPNSPEGQEALRLAHLAQDGGTSDVGGLDERYTDLERIAKLHASGDLTDEEFAAEKRRILG